MKLKEKLSKKEMSRQAVLLVLSGIFLLYGIVFYYLPLAGWIMAFQNYKIKTGLFGSEFVGLKKFIFLFEDDTFIRVIRNTLAMGVLNLVTSFVMAIVFAILLNEVRNKTGKKLVQTISYLPHFLSWIIVTGIIHDSLSNTGIINEILVNLNIIDNPINFFAHEGYFWPIVAFANVWKETGWNAIIYLAAITAIDPCLYEAASIDGIKNRWQELWYVTLPNMKEQLMFGAVLSITGSFGFGGIVTALAGNPPTDYVGYTLSHHLSEYQSNRWEVGYASAISFILFLMMIGANMLVTKLIRKLGE